MSPVLVCRMDKQSRLDAAKKEIQDLRKDEVENIEKLKQEALAKIRSEVRVDGFLKISSRFSHVKI